MADFTLRCISLGAIHLERMRAFYAAVFGIGFRTEPAGDSAIAVGRIGDVEFAMYQAPVTTESPRNPMHLEFFFPDLQRVIDLVTANGGSTNGRPREADGVKAIGVSDPDGNFMVFKQRI